jgi:hypothetical protein
VSQAIEIKEDNLKEGVLGLVVALVEIVRDALKIQALRRMEGGSLTESECERLGETLMKLDSAIDQIKEEQGIMESVQAVRDGLDKLVSDGMNRLINPESWQEEPLNEMAKRS